jgi:hypothetical protein
MTSPHIYFQQYKAFESAQLYITARIDELQSEIYHNCLHFDMKDDHSYELDRDDFVAFLSKIKADRQTQWRAADVVAGMIYYIWFDEMSGQLRINFINSNHARLPFGCDIEFVADEREIISLFLSNSSGGMISWSDLKNAETHEATDVSDSMPYTLKVFQQTFNITK